MASVNGNRRGRTKRSRLVNEINVVPYIDVMLVLLVIFMVTAPFVPTATIELPSAGASQGNPEAYVEVIVEREGALSLRTHHMPQSREMRTSREQLRSAIAELVGGNAATPVVISGDRQVQYEAILDVMDQLKAQGVQRVGLMVKPRPGAG